MRDHTRQIHPAAPGRTPRGRRPRPAPGRGFTLIELLVVIAIIALLVSIALPSIWAIRAQGHAARSMAIIRTVDAGIQQYRRDTGFYPGHRSDGGFATRSHLLAAVLFTPRHGQFPQDFPADAYVTLTEGLLMNLENQATTVEGGLLEGNGPVIVDAFPDPLAILYYPSRMASQTTSYAGDIRQYSEGLNSSLSNPHKGGDFQDFITDPARSVGRERAFPYNSGEYLLIGAGADRQYFTDDDVTNFKR